MRVLLAGATGYIGQAVLKELVVQGYEVIALVRRGHDLVIDDPKAVTIVEADITADRDWDRRVPAVHAVVSCLASRTGAPADAHCVDFEANQKLLKHAERNGVSHFVLLSAICVQKPVLAFQRAKLRFEQLLHDSPVPATVIRATAFFRSLVGQLSRVQAGKPFLLFVQGSTLPASQSQIEIWRDSSSINLPNRDRVLCDALSAAQGPPSRRLCKQR